MNYDSAIPLHIQRDRAKKAALKAEYAEVLEEYKIGVKAMNNVTVVNKSGRGLTVCMQAIRDSFGTNATIQTDDNELTFTHAWYDGLYYYTGDMFAKVS